MQFVVTTVGLQAAADAELGGYKLVVPGFKIGSSFGYTPSEDDENIHGTLLHSGSTSNFYIDAEGQIHYTCWMNDTVGPFTYGELGLYLEDGTLFALGTHDTLQVKVNTTSSSRGNVVSIDTIIVLNNSQATITAIINEIAEAKFLRLAGVHNLLPPLTSPSNAYIIDETDDFGNNILAYRADDTAWTFSTHSGRVIDNGVADALFSTNLSSNQIEEIPGTDSSPERGKYIVMFTSGNFAGEARIVTAINRGANQLAWTEPFVGSGAPGDQFVILQSSMSYYGDQVGGLPPHNHPMTDIIGLIAALAGKSNVGHTHNISDVNGLQAALDALANSGTFQSSMPAAHSGQANYGHIDAPGFKIRAGRWMHPSNVTGANGTGYPEAIGPTVSFLDANGSTPRPFSQVCLAVLAIPINLQNSNKWDNFVQMYSWNVNNFTPIFQTGASDDRRIMGFFWIAIGL